MQNDQVIEKTPIGDTGYPNVYMPWMELMAAFFGAIPFRRQLQEQCLNDNPLFNLREFHVLTIGGPRQCGKTQALLSVMRGNEDARFIKNSGVFTPAEVLRDPDLNARAFEKVGITKEMLEGVKILLIDNGGYPEGDLSPYRLLETMYVLHNDWFDPDLVVIRVL
jgi:hypothetical protein